MVGRYDQLHIMSNHPTKCESYWPNNLTGVAFTKWSRTEGANRKTICPHTTYRMQGFKEKKKKNFQQIYRSYALEEQKTYKGHFY